MLEKLILTKKSGRNKYKTPTTKRPNQIPKDTYHKTFQLLKEIFSEDQLYRMVFIKQKSLKVTANKTRTTNLPLYRFRTIREKRLHQSDMTLPPLQLQGSEYINTFINLKLSKPSEGQAAVA